LNSISAVWLENPAWLSTPSRALLLKFAVDSGDGVKSMGCFNYRLTMFDKLLKINAIELLTLFS
jgi:hypothetical protein